MTETGRRPGAARQRLLDAAMALFADHGVSGTSLQMIADSLGVTKAAVYHQFPSKDEIVLAVIRPALDQFAVVIAAADHAPTASTGRGIVVEGLIDLVIEHRRLAVILQSDHTVARLMQERPSLQRLADDFDRHLVGVDPSPQARVAVAMLVASIMFVGADPRLADLDDETLRESLLDCAHRLLRFRSPRRARPEVARPEVTRPEVNRTEVNPAAGTAAR